ncbi:MAG TPA: AI-2E family transporter [Vicinamibacterales bacterium]|jgi:predicted PurR-regulated permease PerM
MSAFLESVPPPLLANGTAPAPRSIDTAPADDRFGLRLPSGVRELALTIIAAVLVLAALRLASDFLIPLVVTILTAYALNTPVRLLQRLRIPRAAAALIVMLALVGGVSAAGYRFSDQAASAITHLPEATVKLRHALRSLQAGTSGPMQALQRAAAELDEVATDATGSTTVRGASRVQVVQPAAANLRKSLWLGSMSLLGFSGQLVLLVLLAYFMLASGDLFKQKLVRLSGSNLATRRKTSLVIDDINHAVSRFLLIMTVSGAFVAIAAAAAFSTIGLKQAVVWGIVGGLLNTVPYFGAATALCILFVVALLQFGTLQMALLVASLYLVCTATEGLLLKPWLIGRGARMNNVAVFLSLLFWGWLWGPWGMLLAFPVMMVIKVVADHIEKLRPLGELLGE